MSNCNCKSNCNTPLPYSNHRITLLIHELLFLSTNYSFNPRITRITRSFSTNFIELHEFFREDKIMIYFPTLGNGKTVPPLARICNPCVPADVRVTAVNGFGGNSADFYEFPRISCHRITKRGLPVRQSSLFVYNL
jgi:hypothetical protein